jgi:hypothetical protein
MEQEYGAPWGRQLRVTTIFSLGVLLTVAAFGLATGPRHLWIWRLAMVGAPLSMVLAALPFMVRGYTLTSRSLLVHRPGFDTVLPLEGLRGVRGVADEMGGSLRLFGNGGFCSITGWFWNRRLGRYRAFATDPSRAVLLEFAGRKVLVTPHDPQAFIVQARKLLAMR